MVKLGAIDDEPATPTLPILVMVPLVAFVEVQRIVVDCPRSIGFRSNVTEHVGSGFTVSVAGHVAEPDALVTVPV